MLKSDDASKDVAAIKVENAFEDADGTITADVVIESKKAIWYNARFSASGGVRKDVSGKNLFDVLSFYPVAGHFAARVSHVVFPPGSRLNIDLSKFGTSASDAAALCSLDLASMFVQWTAGFNIGDALRLDPSILADLGADLLPILQNTGFDLVTFTSKLAGGDWVGAMEALATAIKDSPELLGRFVSLVADKFGLVITSSEAKGFFENAAHIFKAVGDAIGVAPYVFDLQFAPGSGNTQISNTNSAPVGTSVDVALIIDSSASMSGNDPANKRRDAAKAYLTASLAGDHVSVVDFATTAEVSQPLAQLPGQKQPLVDAINGIGSDGSSTNIRDGLDKACAELLAHGTAGRRGAILLTDGQHNVGSFGNPQQCFKDHGWPIYTFGFGQADATLLSAIASDTGGAFTMAPTSDLVCAFQGVRALIAQVTPGPCTAHNVQPNRTTRFFAAVPANQAQVTFGSSWSGSDIAMSLVLPSGRVIDRTTTAADVTHDLSPTFESYAITNPEAGDWEVRLFGLDVPAGGEDAVVNYVALPKPPVTVTPDATQAPRWRATATPRPAATQTPVAPTVASATAMVPTVAPPVATATRVTGVLGAVKPPNTGSGPAYSDGIARMCAMSLLGGLAFLMMGVGLVRRRR